MIDGVGASLMLAALGVPLCLIAVCLFEGKSRACWLVAVAAALFMLPLLVRLFVAAIFRV